MLYFVHMMGFLHGFSPQEPSIGRSISFKSAAGGMLLSHFDSNHLIYLPCVCLSSACPTLSHHPIVFGCDHAPSMTCHSPPSTKSPVVIGSLLSQLVLAAWDTTTGAIPSTAPAVRPGGPGPMHPASTAVSTGIPVHRSRDDMVTGRCATW